MSDLDIVVPALTAWRENRSGGAAGMQSVLNVIFNRAVARKITPYAVCVQRLQFSSITAPDDPQLGLWPGTDDPQFAAALAMAVQASRGALQDITGGALNYYAISLLPEPEWVREMECTGVIAGQAFYRPAGVAA